MKKTMPSTPLHDQRFEYRNSAATDVTITWRKFGWLPKGEQDERTRNECDSHNPNADK